MSIAIPSVARVANGAAPRRRPYGRRALAGYGFITPAIVFLIGFALLPFLFTVYVSLHDWNMLTAVTSMPFRGLDNYRYLIFEDPLFRQTFANTFVFAAGNVAISSLLALGVALLLNGEVRFPTFWRAVYFLPYVTSSVAISIVWANLYHPSYGLFNGILELFQLPGARFLASLETAMPSESIPLEVYEAAKVDGANAWHRFRSITLPLLRPTLLFVAVVNTLGSLQVFDLAFVLTNGGPVNATNTVVLYMYQTAFNFTRMGRASAMAVMLFLVILVITLVQLRLLREKE
ncbi:MAG: hypothetical protein AUI44_00275 [Chloroflexi bacterium 13_1_40CM_2_67_6]|nr:MAG: hypothetical protein AUI44_00275 [Chloroflexi bacterium 13_1_40CM_2_67_6]